MKYSTGAITIEWENRPKINLVLLSNLRVHPLLHLPDSTSPTAGIVSNTIEPEEPEIKKMVIP
ncbi:hypothetical protein BH18THE2_BH18THE2_18780 [soil metagenome]